MSEIFCYECSRRRNTFARHPWPPCDLNEDGTSKDAQRCGHRRCFKGPGGRCTECRRLAERRRRLSAQEDL